MVSGIYAMRKEINKQIISHHIFKPNGIGAIEAEFNDVLLK